MTTSQLEEKLKEKVDADYSDKVDLEGVKEGFMRYHYNENTFL